MILKREGDTLEVVHPTTFQPLETLVGFAWGIIASRGVGGSWITWARRGASPKCFHVTQVLGCLPPKRSGHFFPVPQETLERPICQSDSFPKRHTVGPFSAGENTSEEEMQ